MRTRNGLIQIIKTLMLWARQNIPLKGHSDNNIKRINYFCTSYGKNDDVKLDNFNSMLMFRLDAVNEMLKENFKKSKKNAIHTTDGPQNCLLGISGQLIQRQIIEEIQAAKYFSILGDETADISNQEQFAFCKRYVYN